LAGLFSHQNPSLPQAVPCIRPALMAICPTPGGGTMVCFVENRGRTPLLGLLPWVLGFAGIPGTPGSAVLFQVWVYLSAGPLEPFHPSNPSQPNQACSLTKHGLG